MFFVQCVDQVGNFVYCVLSHGYLRKASTMEFLIVECGLDTVCNSRLKRTKPHSPKQKRIA